METSLSNSCTFSGRSIVALINGKSQTELAAKEFDASVGGGAVYVKVSGNKEVKEITLKKEIVDPEDVEMLQDLILTCVNEALTEILKHLEQNFKFFFAFKIASVNSFASSCVKNY